MSIDASKRLVLRLLEELRTVYDSSREWNDDAQATLLLREKEDDLNDAIKFIEQLEVVVTVNERRKI